ncbi:MAG: hypothetical protein P8181_16350 [bacterium]
MKRLATILAVVLLVVSFSVAMAEAQCSKTCKTPCAAAKTDEAKAGAAKTDAAKHATILKGEIVEAGCFVERGQKAADNPTCIKKCASSGMPMAFLADDNSVYLIVQCHDALEAYAEAVKLAAEKVEITGYIYERDGMKAIAVTSVQPLEVASK